MKMAGCCPDVVTYTMMLHAYNAAGQFLLQRNDFNWYTMNHFSSYIVLFSFFQIQNTGKRPVRFFKKWKHMMYSQILLHVLL